MKRILVLLVLVCLTLAGISCAKEEPVDYGAAWREVLCKYRDDSNVKQLLFVRHTEGTKAIAQFYEKSEDNNAWILTLSADVYVGKNGIDKTKEGDAKTPTGDFGIRKAFGILKNPGTKLEYYDIKPTTFACDEDCKYYNQIIDSEATGHKCTGEEMYSYSPDYNYGIEVAYNDSNTYPNGSAIFLHCKGVRARTGGCVSFNQADMKYILLHAEKGMRVIIGEN